MYKIMLTWNSPDGSILTEEMNETFKKANYETYVSLVDMCEKWIEKAITEYYYTMALLLCYCPYQRIRLMKGDKTIFYWSVNKYLKERRNI